MLHTDAFRSFLIFLVAAGVVVPLFHRARLGAVMGFLLVGMALGPYALGQLAAGHPWIGFITFDDPERAEALGELGIIFLLFLLGLELSFDRLWQLRRYVLGVGVVQVGISILAIGLIVRLGGGPPPAGLVLGMCLALSSTAIVMQILLEQHRSASAVGRIALSVLLFQDLMVVPILFTVGALGGERHAFVDLAVAFGQAVAAVGGIMVVGRFVVRPLLLSAARTGSRDLLMAITLLIVLGTAAATGAAGLSVALGAFLAGLLMSATEYRHQIEVDFEPFKNLLLGIFFVSVGMSVDLRVVVAQAGWIALALLTLLVVKSVILYGAARAFGVARAASLEVALLLAQAGEFAFVVIGLARGRDLLPAGLATGAIAVVSLSMMLSPLLAAAARRVAARIEPLDHAGEVPDADIRDLEGHVIIGGFGRVGQMIATLLEKEDVPFVALDTDGALIKKHRDDGRRVYFGDASRAEMLERAGAHRAAAFVVTVNAAKDAERMIEGIVALRPDACVLARARDVPHAAQLMKVGARGVIAETLEASLQLGAELLQELDVPDSVIGEHVAAARKEAVVDLGPAKKREKKRAKTRRKRAVR